MKFFLEQNTFVRKILIRLIRILKFDFSIKNHWSGDRFFLNSFTHKGYWYYRERREHSTMILFKKYIQPSYHVVEIGGHIGWISQYFAALAHSGEVTVFEPGSNNIKYFKKNTDHLKNVTHVDVALSNFIGNADFFEDDITGQNNSLLSDYKNVDSVERSHGMVANKTVKRVNVTTLDDFLSGRSVDFIKIDIEGNEFNALLGAERTLQSVKAIMVEVTENQQQCSDFLLGLGFKLHDELGNPMATICREFSGNVFAVRESAC